MPSMPGEHERATAEELSRALRAELPGCTIKIEGAGVHWRATAANAQRACRVNCFWYEPPRADTLVMGPSRSNAHLGSVSTGGQVARRGAEYLVVLHDGAERIAGGRTQARTDVIECLRTWLIEGVTLDDLCDRWTFVDARRRALRRLAGLVVRALQSGGGVRVTIEQEIGYELWAYGNGRSCRIDPAGPGTTGCAFLIGQSQAASATLFDDLLGGAIADWTEQRVSLSELKRCVPQLGLEPHAELLERGDVAQRHWAHLLDGARAGDRPLAAFLPLLELIVVRPAISRFFSFTSMISLCFSYSSHFPFVTEGLPVVDPSQGGGYRIALGEETWTGDAAATTARVEELLARAPRTPFCGNEADTRIPLVNAELVRQGSLLRATRVQRRQWFTVGIEAGRRACQDFYGGPPWSVSFLEDGIRLGRAEYLEISAAIGSARRWLEDGALVQFDPERALFDPD